MTSEEWKRIEDALRGPYGRAVLTCDGYQVTLEVQPTKPLRYEIGVYVNGWMKGEWLMKDCEERRRFCRPIHFNAYTAAMKRGFAKMRKSTLKAMNIEPDKKLAGYLFHWPAFGPLKRHLVKNNQAIALQECFP